MGPVVETIFKNSNLFSVQAFGRTGGMHHPVLPESELWPDQIDEFVLLFIKPLHHNAQHHPMIPFQHLEPALDHFLPPMIIDLGRPEHCGHAAVPRRGGNRPPPA